MPTIREQVERMDKVIESLRLCLDSLIDRIGPALSPMVPTPECPSVASPREQDAPLAEVLRRYNARLDQMIDDATRVTSRVAL